MAVPQPSWSGGRENFWATVPVTKVVIGLLLVSFLASIITGGALFGLLAYALVMPNAITGLLTYPFAIAGPPAFITIVFSALVLWWFGASLERSWGSRLYAVFLALSTVAAALTWTVGAWLLQAGTIIAGPWLLVSAVIVAWAWLNPEETILLAFVLPVKAKWVGWLAIALLYFLFPSGQGVGDARLFLLGFFALGGVAMAYAFARYHRDWAWILRPARSAKASRRVMRHPSSTFVGALTRPWREWQRRRRIAHLQKMIKFEEEDAGQSKG